MNEDPRLQRPGLCGVTRMIGHTEFICVADVHDTDHQGSSRPSAYGYYPKSERHYMVNRWPGRVSSGNEGGAA